MKSGLTGYLGMCAVGWCDQNLFLAIRGGGHSAAGIWDAIDRLSPGSVYVSRHARFGGMIDRHIGARAFGSARPCLRRRGPTAQCEPLEPGTADISFAYSDSKTVESRSAFGANACDAAHSPLCTFPVGLPHDRGGGDFEFTRIRIMTPHSRFRTSFGPPSSIGHANWVGNPGGDAASQPDDAICNSSCGRAGGA